MIQQENKLIGQIQVINAETLVNVFQSQSIKTVFKKIIKRSKTLFDCEQGVNILLDLNSPSFLIETVWKDNVEYGSVGMSSEKVDQYLAGLQKRKYPVVLFHTHTPTIAGKYSKYDYIPSHADLLNLTDARETAKDVAKYDGFPITIIGIIVGNTIQMLLIQETGIISSCTRKYCTQDMGYVQSLRDIIDTLKQYGYNAAQITYNLKTGVLAHDPQTLNTFSYIPRNIE